MDIPHKAKDFLNSVDYATLATVCEDGSPWNSPVFYAYDENMNIYWSSHPDSVHSQNILRSGQVFVVVYDSTDTSAEGLYIQAAASVLKDKNDIGDGLHLLGIRRGKPFTSIEKYMDKGPQRIWKAVPINMWTNDADKDSDGDYIRDYRSTLT